MNRITFPSGFLWGAATSAYQVEGSPLADGACPTSWHRFSHTRGRIKDGSNGDVACDHYHRFADDVTHMKNLHLKAYRFSVGWGRIFPEPGQANARGLDHYDRMVDVLLKAGIEPWITIFHFDEPLWLSEAGSFVNRASVDHLLRLGEALFKRFADRVRNWITINEPTVYAFLGRGTGNFPPGRRLDVRGMMQCMHHLLLAHARLCRVWASLGAGGMIGLAHHAIHIEPADPARPRDQEAARFMDESANGTVLDPLLKGFYPPRLVARLGRFLPRTLDSDLADMKGSGTYLGINYYARNRYRWSRFLPYFHAKEHLAAGAKRSAMWEIYPPGLEATLLRLKRDYGNPPCLVAENGYPLPETPDRDPLDDQERISYLADHIAVVGKAIQQGVDCRGYFHWSLLDNFEWNLGLAMRFGLLRTDFTTQHRTWRKSAYWYRDLIARNALEPGPVPPLPG